MASMRSMYGRIELKSLKDDQSKQAHLVQLAPSSNFEGGGAGGVFDSHEPGNHALHSRPVEAAVGVPVLEVHA